ncbi:MAG: hypothetical protein LKH33_06830 [Acetobacter sp.]|jgi:hypothetical protein|nr:hypothetical protein [Acetobacter sp.]MCH4060493.1 hypothetical protein [Acetobacter sp.]MCH4087433.1 hypothetical protein [Acetobacter sp.]MCI1293951.1 hypothetical protein [Acetobacter sp.]MCI1320455.1 hypothetical protein [Acetobacter sp.]
MTSYNEYKVKGTPDDISSFVSTSKTAGADITPVRTLDGVSYVFVRCTQALSPSTNLSLTGPELSDALVGVFYDAPDVAAAGDTAIGEPEGSSPG